MKCPFSGKPCLRSKEIFVKEVVEGEPRSLYLCHKCGQDYLKTLPDAKVVTEFLRLISTAEGLNQLKGAMDFSGMEGNLPCPQCGKTLSSILETREVGCSNCYQFHNLLELVSVATQPKKLPEEEIVELEFEMQKAIDREDYEWAAECRDEIKRLNKVITEDTST